MRIVTKYSLTWTGSLEDFRPKNQHQHWDLVVSGYWSQDTYHSGHISYWITRLEDGTWVMESIQEDGRDDADDNENDEDHIGTEETTCDAPQRPETKPLAGVDSVVIRRIRAVLLDGPPEMSVVEAAEEMSSYLMRHGEIMVEEPDCEGMIDI